MGIIKIIKDWWYGKKGIRYDGVQYEEYKKRRNKWLRLAFIGVIVPFLLPLILSYFDESLSFTEMIGNGEVLLSLYALVLPLAFDLLEAKRKADEELDKSFWLCIVITLLLIVVYSAIRLTTPSVTEILQETDTTREFELMEKRKSLIFRNCICSLLLSFSAIFCCNRAIIALYNHTDNQTVEA